MSINHSYEIGSDGLYQLMLNLSGLDGAQTETSALRASIYAYCLTTGSSHFTCQLELSHLQDLYSHLSQYSVIREPTSSVTGRFVEIQSNHDEIMRILERSDNASLILALQHIISDRLTGSDINTILGRKDAIAEFEDKLINSSHYREADWQKFFERNEWIFGYGLNYQFLKILQREAHISHTDLNGSNDVIADFLLSDSQYTKIVELKTPETPLFASRQNRSDSWRLSNELTDAVSQILAQKANWEIESQSANYTSDGMRILEDTCDPECILVIGSTLSITGSDREKIIKKKTLELYRRNLKSISILFYDELFERAKFIVKNAESLEASITDALEL
ncbi:Shedu immune nuclease family protein [Providencia sp. SKLX074055]|uniref:Shedu immune nuclease family protein n=1 Tax=Providencia xihuensis TaxID=3342830 RepID=UPI0035BF3049